jgi:hypothetical protein
MVMMSMRVLATRLTASIATRIESSHRTAAVLLLSLLVFLLLFVLLVLIL